MLRLPHLQTVEQLIQRGLVFVVVLAHLAGTPYFPQVDGGILFVEDVGETPYRIERMLYQLHHAGVLARQRAILLGRFTEYALSANDGGYDLDTVVAQLRSVCATPILTGLPSAAISPGAST